MGDKSNKKGEIDQLVAAASSSTDWLTKLACVDAEEFMRNLRGVMTADELEEYWERIGAIGNPIIVEDLGRVKKS